MGSYRLYRKIKGFSDFDPSTRSKPAVSPSKLDPKLIQKLISKTYC